MNINAAEVAAALNNNKLIITNNASEITSSTPLRGSKPGNNSLIVVVCSDKVQLQHKASCYRGHGYSNRLNSLQGCTTIQPTRSDLQGGVNLVRERPTEAIRHDAAHPGLNREAIRRTISYAPRGLGPSPLHAPARCVAGR